MALKDSWKKVGKDFGKIADGNVKDIGKGIGNTAADFGKAVLKSIKVAADKANDWADGDDEPAKAGKEDNAPGDNGE